MILRVIEDINLIYCMMLEMREHYFTSLRRWDSKIIQSLLKLSLGVSQIRIVIREP